MDIFCHINELGKEGWESLRTLVLACNKVILWAPSASYLESFREINPLIPSADELLWYVRNGNIQVRAREWWIQNGKQRQEHGWQHARKWIEGFDEEILDIWKQNQREGKVGAASAQVISLGAEGGWDWAREQVEARNIDYELLVNRIKKKSMLVGYLEKADRAMTPKEAAVTMLRDAKNHGEGFGQSGADRNFGVPKDRILVKILSNAAKEIAAPIYHMPKKKAEAKELIPIINSIIETLEKRGKAARYHEEAFERTQKILADSAEIKRFRDFVTTADYITAMYKPKFVRGEVAQEVSKELMKGARNQSLLDYLKPKGKTDIAALVVSLLLAVGGGMTGGVLAAPIGLAPEIIVKSRAFLQWLGWISDDYDGIRWPLYIAYGTNNVNRRKRESLLNELLNI